MRRQNRKKHRFPCYPEEAAGSIIAANIQNRKFCPVDVEFNCETGCITALVVPGPGSFCFCFWGAGSEYIIPWNCIRQIGDDIILVEIDEKYCCKKA